MTFPREPDWAGPEDSLSFRSEMRFLAAARRQEAARIEAENSAKMRGLRDRTGPARASGTR